MQKISRLTALLSILLAVSLILSGCGGDNGGNTTAPTATTGASAANTPVVAAATNTTTAPTGKTVTVEEQDFKFSPADITINVGDSIVFVNKGQNAHTAQAVDGSFNSGNMDPGATFTQTFTTAGTFTYYCKYHGKADGSSGMVGTITVQTGGATTGNAGGATPTSAGGTSSGPTTVELQDYKFAPATISISAGSMINFVNKGAVAHTATAADNSWDSGNLDAGQSFSHTFATAGTFIVYCKYHGSADGKGMAMTVTVTAGGGAAGGETPTTAAAPPTATTAAAAQPTSAGGTTGGASQTVELQDYKFAPATLTINAGDSINFVNKGAVAHTATAGDSSWDSGNLDPGQSFSHTFATAGTVIVYCRYHGSADGKGMAMTVTVMPGGGAAGGTTPTSGAGGYTTGAPDSLSADDQPAGNSVVVKHIHANQDGFVTVHANTADNKPGAQLGHTVVKQGDNDNVVVQVITPTVAGDKVWPMLHIDAGTIGTYEFPGPDAPVIIGGNIVMQQITITAATANQPSVQADDQPAGASIIVKKVVAAQDGFVTVHANTADNKPGDQLGHTAVKAGENDNVVVALNPAPKVGDKVWPMLHIDAGVIGTYEFPGPDAPVIISGNIVMQQITLTAQLPAVQADDQPAGSSITVKKVIAAQDGFITVHANTAANQPGDQLGHTQVKAGENDNVVVQLSPAPKPGDKVWPMLHIDAGTIGTYEFPGPDAPVILNGNIVMQQITLTVATPSVEADDQPAASSITIKKVIAAQDGFITVHANTAANQPGDQLGHTLVKAGENDNVVVILSPAPKVGDKVWPMLHIDAGTIGTYEFPGPDAPVILNGNIVMKQITMTNATQTVNLEDNKFSATDITINVGDSILFVNTGKHAHTVTAGSGGWDSGNLDAGQSFAHTFTTPGVFTVYCRYHGSADGKGMAAAITVQAGTPSP